MVETVFDLAVVAIVSIGLLWLLVIMMEFRHPGTRETIRLYWDTFRTWMWARIYLLFYAFRIHTLSSSIDLQTTGNRPMELIHKITPIVWIVPAILLLAAVARLPYGFYTFTRTVTCGTAALIAVVGFRERSSAQAWSVLFSLIAILFNPIVPIHLNYSDWFYLDLGTAGVFAAHLIFVRGLHSKTKG